MFVFLFQTIALKLVDSYAALADWEEYEEWKKSTDTWSVNSSKQMADLVMLFDNNVALMWPERTCEVQWSAGHLMNEAKSVMLLAADRIRSSRSVHSAPGSAWKIVEYFTETSLELGHLSCDNSVLVWLPLAHGLSFRNESPYQWMEHLLSVFRGASCTDVAFAQSFSSMEWSRWLHWYTHLDNQALDIVAKCSRTDLSSVALACREGNLRLAERLLRRLLSSSQGHDLATLLMNDALKMKVSSSSARLAVQIQFQGAKLLQQ